MSGAFGPTLPAGWSWSDSEQGLGGAKPIELAPRELMLLKYWSGTQHRELSRVLTRTELCERGWKHAHEYNMKLVEVFIGR